MDIQLFATDEELREFPENKTDSNTVPDKTNTVPDKTNTVPDKTNTVPDKTFSPNSINLMASDLPRPHTDLPKFPSSLPDSKIKCRTKRSCRYKSRSNGKNPIGGRSVVQVHDCLASIQEKQLVIQSTNAAYLGQLVGRSFTRSARGSSSHSQSARSRSVSAQCGSTRSSHPSTVVSPAPARLERARLDPLSPGTPVHPPWHPDQ